MKEHFGNYTIESDDEIFRLNYVRTDKDWFDILLASIFGLGALVVVCFLVNKIIVQGVEWIFIVLGAIFGFTAFVKLQYSYARLSEPTHEIIRLDKKSGEFALKRPYFRKQKISSSEINCIEYELHTKWVGHGEDLKKAFWVEARFAIIEESPLDFVHINPDNIVDMGEAKVKRELEKRAKDLIQRVAQELGVEARQKATVNEEDDK